MDTDKVFITAEGVRKIGNFGFWADKNDPDYSRKLIMNYEDCFYIKTKKDKKLEKYLTEKKAIVYFIVVNGRIYKIGGSGAEDGIKGLLSFYLRSTGAPGANRYIINSFIHEELEKGNVVEFYAVCKDAKFEEVYGPYGKETILTTIEHTSMESLWINSYRKANDGKYPIWNFQECPKNKDKRYQEAYKSWKNYRHV